MRFKGIQFSLAVLAVVLAILPAAAQAGGRAHVALPFEEEGTIDGAPYRIVVPANWNGTLLVWVHGARDKADHPGEVDDREPEAIPLNIPALEELFLSQGFALAGSALRDNGVVIKEGLLDTVALTNFFKGKVGDPDRTIIWGASLGAGISLRAIENFPGVYDGAVPICTPGAGEPRNQDGFAAFGLAYEVAFGWPASWGVPENVRNDLDLETEVFPVLLLQLSNPANFGLFEFMRLVNDMPAEDFLSGPYPSLFFRMYDATEGMAELERRAGGSPVQNLDHIYSLSPEEKAYLAGLGVNTDALLAAMSARRFAANPSARNYLVNFGEPSGNITRPVLSMHTTVDGNIVVGHESAYRELVEAAGKEDLLLQVFTNGVGHCSFSPVQMLTAVKAMDSWIQTGVRPGPELFPETLGFAPDFDPPPFPYQGE